MQPGIHVCPGVDPMKRLPVTRRGVLRTIGAGAVVGSVATGTATAHRGGMVGHLTKVWATTYKYTDPAKAYRDGYVVLGPDESVVPLDEVTEKGHAVCGMGYHFVNPAYMGQEDLKRPQVLAYGVDDAGDLTLGAVEYVIPKELGYEETSPDLFGHDGGTEVWQEDSPMDGFWSLHAWIHAENQEGVFVPFNSDGRFHPEGCMDPREGEEH